MIANFPYSRTLVLTGLVFLVGGGMVVPPSPTLAAPSSEQEPQFVPSRRKPGGSRQLVEAPGRRKPGGTRDGFAEIPGRRKPGGTRTDIAQVPGRRKPGGARTDIALLLDQKVLGNTAAHCSSDLQQMTALIPENLEGLTASATPTLYFAVPTLSDIPNLEFVLQDEQERVVYTAKVMPQSSGGVMAVEIPESHALEQDKTYHWYLSVVCDANYRERDLVVEGLVTRVADNRTNSATPSLEQVQFYQQNDLWQDALHTAMRLYQQEGNSANVQEAWRNLLKSENLSEFENLLQDRIVSNPPSSLAYQN